MSHNLIGVSIGKYRCVDFIGHGGMAEVYRAEDTELGRMVAIKVLHPFLVTEEGFMDRFRREARTLAALKHPNIVEVYDSGLQDFNNYVVMEYVAGPTLKSRLRELSLRHEHMTIAEVRRIFEALCAALRYAHQAGVVHRDVKPTNIMLADDGRIVLTDFGLAKIIGSTVHTASMAMIGTPAYMAPEQAQAGAADPRSDIYALGVILYEVLTGKLPFQAETPFVMITKHAQEDLPPLSALRRDLPRSLDRVLLKATAKDPNARFQSVDQFAEALNAALEGRRLPFLFIRRRLSRSARNWIGVAAVGTLTLIGGIGLANGWISAPAPTGTPTQTSIPTPTATRVLRARIIGPADLHAQPNRASAIVEQLASGTEVALLNQDGSWWQIRVLDRDRVGWVMDENLVFVLPTATPTLTNTPPPGATLTPTPTPTPTRRPTLTPSATPSPTLTSTSEPESGAESTPVGLPATPARTPGSQPSPNPTNPTATVLPTSTNVTVEPTETHTPAPTATHTPAPTATHTPRSTGKPKEPTGIP